MRLPRAPIPTYCDGMILHQITRPFRFAIILTLMFIFITQMATLWVFVRNQWARVRWSNRILTQYCRFGLWLMRVRVRAVGLERVNLNEGALFVGNHLSYMDVLVIHSVLPACFVTSREVRETPVLGLVCRLAGCLFVERRSRASLLNEVGEIAAGLSEGLRVAIFPESTSTNGEQILPFKRPLFLAAIQSKRPVVPFCLNYVEVGGRPINKKTRDTVFWYGDMGFAGHLWALAGNGGSLAEIIFIDPIAPTLYETESASSLALQSRAAIERVFKPVPS